MNDSVIENRGPGYYRKIAVVGMWHLGCSVAASWLRLGHTVTAIDFDSEIVEGLKQGRAPLVEPGVNEEFAEGLNKGSLRVSDSPSAVAGCSYVFITFDTPVAEDDMSDTTPIHDAIDKCAPHLTRDTIVVVSSQMPAGESELLRSKIKAFAPTAELVYSPENLRLGMAIQCYLQPGHIVLGAESEVAADRLEDLFSPMNAKIFRMNIPSAEMAKHCINSFLATSVTLANQWADIAMAIGADYAKVKEVLHADPRIGKSAYITPGIGFSGGTLGRDLRVLDLKMELENHQPENIFQYVWDYNSHRPMLIVEFVKQLLGDPWVGDLRGKQIALLGMTYKPGTSTLRRSIPLLIAEELCKEADVTVHDPLADWSEATLPSGMVIAESVYDAVEDADIAILLTEWPMYTKLDFAQVASKMNRPLVFDTKGFLQDLTEYGIEHIVLGRGSI